MTEKAKSKPLMEEKSNTESLIEEKSKNENLNLEEKGKKCKKGKKKKKNRCALKGCKKKLKLTNMICRCKYIYCDKHRLPESHNCKWDPRSDNEIEKYKKNCCLNVTAHFSKIDKI